MTKTQMSDICKYHTSIQSHDPTLRLVLKREAHANEQSRLFHVVMSIAQDPNSTRLQHLREVEVHRPLEPALDQSPQDMTMCYL